MTSRLDSQDLGVHTRYLTAYATRAVGDRDLAQDLVQDTLVAALSADAGFEGRSALRTWLVGILRHKIMDAYRERARAPASLDELHDAGVEPEARRRRGRPVELRPRPGPGARAQALLGSLRARTRPDAGTDGRGLRPLGVLRTARRRRCAGTWASPRRRCG